MTLLQLLTWKATSREASALAEGEPEVPGVAGAVGEVVVLEGTEVAEAVAEVIGMMVGAAAGVGGVGLGL